MNKLLIICDNYEAYRNYVREHKLSVNDAKRINSYQDIRGFHAPTKYILLTAPKSGLPEILDYMEHHGIQKAEKGDYEDN